MGWIMVRGMEMDVKGGSGNGDGCGEIGEHICKMGGGGTFAGEI